MAYSTLGWHNGQEPAINAENLNHMDEGIADADAAATAAATLAGQKMDKVSGGTAGDFAALDANGNVVDSGKSASDFAPSSETGYVVRQTTTASIPRAYTYSTEGDSYLPVIRAESTPESIVQRTVDGQIVTGYPTVSSHAATKGYVDAYAVPKTTLTYKVYGTNQNGSQVTFDFAGNSASANSIARRTSGGQLFVADPTNNGHAANKQYVDDNFFQKAVVTPSLSTYQDINGYTWQELYTAMQNAGAAPIYLNNADRWLHFGTNQVDTICNQFITFIFDEVLANKYFFTLKFVKEISSNNQQIKEIQCTITSAGLITAVEQ